MAKKIKKIGHHSSRYQAIKYLLILLATYTTSVVLSHFYWKYELNLKFPIAREILSQKFPQYGEDTDFILDVLSKVKEVIKNGDEENYLKNNFTQPYTASPTIINKVPEPKPFTTRPTIHPVIDPNCPTVNQDDYQNIKIPKYRLNPNKYLSAVLPWGPNNQIRGLMETILLAIKLDRTLVVPPFFKHKIEANDDQSAYAMSTDPTLWLDISKLSTLIPIITFDELRTKCKSWEVIFLAKPVDKGPIFDRFASFQSFSGLTFLKQFETDITSLRTKKSGIFTDWFHHNISIEPDINHLKTRIQGRKNSNQALRLPFDAGRIKELYQSDKACAFWAYPYRNFDFKAIWKYARDPSPDFKMNAFSGKGFDAGVGKVTATDVELMMEAVNSVRFSKFIHKSAEIIRNEILGNPKLFILIHWRYSDQDDGSNTINSICISHEEHRCKLHTKIVGDPKLFGEKLYDLLTRFSRKVLFEGVKIDKVIEIPVYIATPTEIFQNSQFFLTVSFFLLRLYSFIVFKKTHTQKSQHG